MGPGVKINAGGSPGQSAGAAAKLPAIPNGTDTPAAGEIPNKARANQLSPSTDSTDLGPQQLIVDVWGDPESGGQVQLLDPEDDV